jgi:hypothetical protein
LRRINFYQARDEMHREFLRGSGMPGPTRAIFRYLLEFTLYGESGYGWVRHDACGIDTIAASTGFSDRSVKEYLRQLEANGLIKRYRKDRKGGANDEIRIEWSYLYIGLGEGDAREGDAPTNSVLGEGDAPTIPYTEKGSTEPGGVVIDMTQRRTANV